MIFDKEVPASARMAPQFLSYVKRHDSRALFGDPPPFHMPGPDRQQWYMLWADNFTRAEYVGFVDSDTMFTSVITNGDLFVDSKPRAVVIYGRPLNFFWEATPNQTLFAIGKKEPFKGMSYFPVILKTAHLKPMREHIMKTIGASHFDEAFRQIISRTPYSQFNIMVTYLWNFHHDEYFWDVTEQEEGWIGPVPPGQVKTLQEGDMTRELLTKGRPRSSMHGKYDGILPDREDWTRRILLTGFCFHPVMTSSNASQCESLNTTIPNRLEWTFEGTDYSRRSHVVTAHQTRRDRIKKECRIDFDWDLEEIRLLVCDFRVPHMNSELTRLATNGYSPAVS
jgi:hypothetical protein